MSYRWKCTGGCGRVLVLERDEFPIACCEVLHKFPRGVKKQLPGTAARAANLARDSLKHVAGGLKFVDDFTRNWRLEQCQACDEFFDHELQTCSHPLCGCGMKKKRGIVDALGWATKRCPIGRWENPPRQGPYSLADITICVTSFLRPECLKRFVVSARFYYPGLRIVVADQSGDEAAGENYQLCRNAPNVTWLELPFDCGISNARNAAVKSVETRLICLLDDDHVFTEDSRLERLLDVLNSDKSVSLVCGPLRMDNKVGEFGKVAAGWFADFEVKDKTLNHLPVGKPWQVTAKGTSYRKLNRYINCFLTTKNVLVNYPWDSVHKIANEHLDHCLTLWSAGLQAAYTPQCVFGELHSDSDQYKEYRKRTTRSAMLMKWGISKQSGTQGMEVEPGIPKRQTTMPIAPSPNIVLLTIGHTGSTMIAGLFSRLGWNLPDNDPEYNEPFAIRQAGVEWQRCGAPIDGDALLASCPQPWIIKNPAWCEELEQWLPFLAKYRPTLIYLTRDAAAVKASWEKRENDMEFLMRRYELADRHYAYWPWSKQRIRYEDVAEWVASFDLQRAIPQPPASQT